MRKIWGFCSHVVWSIQIFLNVTLCFWLFAVPIVLEALWSFKTLTETNPGAQQHILEVLNLNVAIVVIPGTQEAEFWSTECVLLQFYTDANEAELWLNEKMALVASAYYGEDEPSAQALLQQHRDLQGELNAYNGDIASLNSQAEKLVQAGITMLEVMRAKLCRHMEQCVVSWCWWHWLRVLVCHFIYPPYA